MTFLDGRELLPIGGELLREPYPGAARHLKPGTLVRVTRTGEIEYMHEEIPPKEAAKLRQGALL